MGDVYLQARRDGAGAKRFFKRLLRSHGGEPRKIVTDKLRSYGVAHRELMPKQFMSVIGTQIIEQSNLRAHAVVSNLFNLGRHLVRAQHYRDLRMSAFNEGSMAVA